ncbi:hypothetical protein [Methylorubrum populi]|jgi:hypothetical protein|uniref:hypothetical protein n=1 Tax=Methylorubrum populi TaxID=223967 RepID=UPI0007C925D5|nr:hypothetical protein [Methylorubrum populi]OAH18531.1 hypothetical protein AX289_31530 [Methylorubrum populi]
MRSASQTLSPVAAWYRPTVYYYGGALIVIGLVSVVLGGLPHWTVLIPAILGGLVCLAGFAARQGVLSDVAASACALTIALLALAGTATAVPVLPYALAGSSDVANAGAVVARSATALVSGGFVVTILLLWWRSR